MIVLPCAALDAAGACSGHLFVDAESNQAAIERGAPGLRAATTE